MTRKEWSQHFKKAWDNQVRCIFCDKSGIYESLTPVLFAQNNDKLEMSWVCLPCGGRAMAIMKAFQKEKTR